MDYKSKYLKYKKKCLILKGGDKKQGVLKLKKIEFFSLSTLHL